MDRLFKLILLAIGCGLLFHFVYRSTSFVMINWIFDDPVWPDQKSFFSTLKRAFVPSVAYFLPTLLSLTMLLRNKYRAISIAAAYRSYVAVTVIAAVITGYMFHLDVTVNQLVFIGMISSPLWIFLIQLGILKGIGRGCS